MNTIILSFVVFSVLLRYIVIIDVILSWLSLFGLRYRPRFISQLLDPLYNFIRTYIPTRIGLFDLTPIIILFGTIFFEIILISNFPEVKQIINSFGNR